MACLQFLRSVKKLQFHFHAALSQTVGAMTYKLQNLHRRRDETAGVRLFTSHCGAEVTDKMQMRSDLQFHFHAIPSHSDSKTADAIVVDSYPFFLFAVRNRLAAFAFVSSAKKRRDRN